MILIKIQGVLMIFGEFIDWLSKQELRMKYTITGAILIVFILLTFFVYISPVIVTALGYKMNIDYFNLIKELYYYDTVLTGGIILTYMATPNSLELIKDFSSALKERKDK